MNTPTLNKQYEVTVLFGFATDTYDLLGYWKVRQKCCLRGHTNFLLKICSMREPLSAQQAPLKQHLVFELESKLKNFTGKIEQKYPPYSSRTVDGKPLWALGARRALG
jgi:tRNA U55 pseudouridine synthase TruB